MVVARRNRAGATTLERSTLAVRYEVMVLVPSVSVTRDLDPQHLHLVGGNQHAARPPRSST
ncbi:hypothetical protein A5647_18380 [Mycobacterium sp. 1100029.7]|nr:hypothetical protein A5647_18380 [Mycobacterium sp. 1100029.7]